MKTYSIRMFLLNRRSTTKKKNNENPIQNAAHRFLLWNGSGKKMRQDEKAKYSARRGRQMESNLTARVKPNGRDMETVILAHE